VPLTEHTINDAIAAALRQTRRAWQSSNVISSENTGMLKGSSKRPDILVIEANVSPVVIETEVLPAITVEAEAKSRLGQQLKTTGRTILSSIALRVPDRLRNATPSKLHSQIVSASDFQMILYTGTDPASSARWPGAGWIEGTIADISILAQSASVPPAVIEEAANQLANGVIESAGLLEQMAITHKGAIENIAAELKQDDSAQTQRMATTILTNAFIFQETLAGGPDELAKVKSLDELRNQGALTKSVILAEWRAILKINYWPIFDIARRILQLIPTAYSKPLIETLVVTAERLLENRLMRSHDLTGAVFQRLIADRKFLAAFYTTPAAAALLVGLAVIPEKTPTGGSWTNPEDVKNLRIVDFACGTGTLLTTAYQRVSQLHELAGGDSEVLHPDMMALAFMGCDVLPAAAHLTASMLAGAHPLVKYKQSSILTVAYGVQEDGGVALGSLALLDPQGKIEDFLHITSAKVVEGMGEFEKARWADMPHRSFDVVIMNPPFTRDTGHEAQKIGVRNPMFAAFSATDQEQKKMADKLKDLTDKTSAHGNAGEASVFLVLADRKLKIGGMLALVMPLSLMSGEAWEDSRSVLTKRYDDLIVVSIAGAQGAELSFSADTDIGECLVVGRKVAEEATPLPAVRPEKRGTFVVLNERPAFPMLGASAARQIHNLIAAKNLRSLEDGPFGGTLLNFGNDVIGQAVEAPLPTEGGWNLARVADIALAQAAYQIAVMKRIWLPTMEESESIAISMTTVDTIGQIGPYHADINGKTQGGGIRGPFDVSAVKPGSAPTYPVLWSHDAEKQRSIAFEGDSEGLPRKGKNAKEKVIIEFKLKNVWNSASHCHFSRDFRFNSQSTSMQFTQRRTIGGRAWISIRLASEDQEKALVLWSNTSLGLLLHWYHANKQQSGRGSIGVSVLPSLPILDVTALSAKQLKKTAEIFDDLSGMDLLPFHEIDHDKIRQELDSRFLRDVLGLSESVVGKDGAIDLLRRKLAREPSIRGQK
jgi:hypothetical protein